jgi:lipoate-protein ligase B
LKPYGDDVHDYVRRMERVVIETLAELGIEAGTVDGLTGVWTGGRKIGSIGIHISRSVTTHGLAINVNNDLQPFQWIVPCGIEGVQMTSVSKELGAEREMDEVMTILARRYGEVFERQPTEVPGAELARRVEGLGDLDPTGATAALA